MTRGRWFVGRDGRQLGCYQFETLRLLLERKKLLPDDLVWTEGMADWQRVDATQELMSSERKTEGPEPAVASRAPETAAEDSVGANRAKTLIRSRANYLVRHWRGELSLPVSYWVNGALLGGVLAAVLTAAAASDFMARRGALGTGAWSLGVLVVVIASGVWQAIGVWRSAGQHASRGGAAGWATTARVMVVLGLIRLAGFGAQQLPTLQQSIGLMFSGDPIPASVLHVVNHATEVEIAGGMSFGTTDSLKTILDATPTIRTVQLNNVGGWVSEGLRVGELIAGRSLSTFTARECVSACLLAFMAGKERYLGANARLGFHEVSVAGVGGEVAAEGQKEFRDALLQRGIPSAFVTRALATPASDMWYPTTQELLQAHVITAVVDEREYATTGVSAWHDSTKIEADFAAVPIFAALKRAEPQTYEELERSYVSAIQSGAPQKEIAAKIRNTIYSNVLSKYMRIGPDAQLVAYWRTQLTEMRELRAVDPSYCVALLFPSPDTDASHLTSLFSKEAGAADLQNLIGLLDAASEAPAAPPPEAAVQAALSQAVARAEKRLPGSLHVVSNPEQSKGNPKMLCDSEVAFYEAIVSLPVERSGPLLRFLAASG